VRVIESTSGPYSILIFLTQRFLWPFTTLSETVDLFERSMASNKRILDLLDTEHIIKDQKNAVNINNYDNDISFSNIKFQYDDNKNLFNDLKFIIKKKSLTGIVGQTGSGKTTIIKLLLRFYDSQKGNISIGDINIKNIKLKDLRKNIGYVSQDIFMFDGSIKENIIYPETEFNDNKVEEAAKLSQCLEFINKLPDKYDTLIGERGQKLSSGQKQRIGIARAIYKNPPILIFDEATSAIDNETEHLIKVALNEISKNRTTIVIAHRLSTVRNADNIIVIGDGNIIEEGNHNELINNKRTYKNPNPRRPKYWQGLE